MTDGHVRTGGSHRQYKHAVKKGASQYPAIPGTMCILVRSRVY